ncbi:GDSL esterase/lipase At5g03610-like [Primulina eburnea]|uniref:GDSL esterase/lipase At5g03610-like n=1 Tax=Primulina eburnea TaxID=1245227 RepID=UPI003C6CA8B4
MAPYNLLLISFCCCCFLLISVAQCSPHHHRLRRHVEDQSHDHAFEPTKFFVFGDSYADTGNVRKTQANSWKNPYGSTFPGKPAGRFSDGRVLTDYFAKFLGLKTPVAYRWMKFVGKNKLRNGMNFAYGGSGVFNTYGDALPNMTTQIDFLDELINASVYTNWDLNYSSVALISLAGNDYAAYLAKGGSIQDLPTFISLVIDQLMVNIKRIRGLGVSKIAVTSLEPLGCLPRITRVSSYQQCNMSQNLAVSYHNLLLQQAVTKLNNKTEESPVFVVDLYSSFTSVLEQKGDVQGNLKFEMPLKPCCIGISNGHSCGNVDKKGVKMYTVCSDPNSAFFWDSSHPTQAGWLAVYNALKPSLEEFLKHS